MEPILPGNAITSSLIVASEMQNTDGKLLDINGDFIVDSFGDTISLGAGIIPDNALVDTTLTPSDVIVATYTADNAIVNTSLLPASTETATYTEASDPTTVTWG